MYLQQTEQTPRERVMVHQTKREEAESMFHTNGEPSHLSSQWWLYTRRGLCPYEKPAPEPTPLTPRFV